MTPLSPKRRSELRSEAHKLNPLVLIGDKGLTDEVVAEIDRTLRAHELIKVRAATDDRGARDTWLKEICGRLGAHPVQQIGKIFVIYREKPADEAEEDKPKARPAAKGKAKAKPDPRPRGDDDARRTSRPRSRTPAPRPASGPRRRPRNTSR